MEMAAKTAEKAARSAALPFPLHGFFGALPHGDGSMGEADRPLPTRVDDDGRDETFRGFLLFSP